MGEKPDDVRQRGPLDETGRDPAPLAGETEVDEIEVTRVEIEQTRADMSETVDAIQERLSPENLKDQAKERVREATVGRARETGSGIMETIRENPVPAALTGIGLGWLLMSGRNQRSTQVHYRSGPYAYDNMPRYEDDYPPRYEERGASGSSGQALERAQDRVGETTSRAQERAGELASRTQDRAGELAGRTRDRADRLGDRAQHLTRRAGGRLQRMLQENPLTMGALAVGAGTAIGLAVPETRKEHEVMGEARDNLVDKAQDKAQEAQQKVQSVAEEAQSAAKQEAQNQGLAN